VNTVRPVRFEWLDVLRALAIVWMALFHLAFDLNHFGLLEPRHAFHRDALWTTQRACIVSLFLFCAGLGQAAAWQAAQDWPRFWKRWAQIAVCALLVSAGSALMFPKSWIFFGVLHGVAVMLILTRLTASWGLWLWPAGALALVLPWVLKGGLFDHPWLSWLGLVTKKPVTEDYVPVLPWLGVMWWGLAAGLWLLKRQPDWLGAGVPPWLQPLVVLGRWSLSFYMLHQPVFLGLILAGRALGWW
jgi:uncharacterized membrane protein